MSTYYYRDGQLFTTKTMCNLVQTWQQECRAYPDAAEIRRATEQRQWLQEQVGLNKAYAKSVGYTPLPELLDETAL